MQTFLFNAGLKPIATGLPMEIRGVKFGEGCFETMYYQDSSIRLGALHFNRLENTLNQLGIQLSKDFSISWLTDFLNQALDNRNTWRIRLTIWNGGLALDEDVSQGYVGIEARVLYPPKPQITIGVLNQVQSALFPFQNHKSLNFHLYTYAMKIAREQQVDDVLLVNPTNEIIESSISNVFVVKGGTLLTPDLSVGCVDGVMRKFVMHHFPTQEQTIRLDDLEQSTEIFLTNALGIRSVKEWNGKKLSQKFATSIREKLDQGNLENIV